MTVSDLSGRTVGLAALPPSLRLHELVASFEQELGYVGDETLSLVFGTKTFTAKDLSKTLASLGIIDGSHFMGIKRLVNRSTCIRCSGGHRVRFDVTIGALHDSWGRRWNKCAYDCERCGTAILPGEHVNACLGCKCFWHRSCNLARSR